jgi:hypothetical protein
MPDKWPGKYVSDSDGSPSVDLSIWKAMGAGNLPLH